MTAIAQPLPHVSTHLRSTAAFLAALAVPFAVLSAAAGLFVPGLYRDDPAWIRQARAADLVTLVAVAPVLAVSLWRARRGSAIAWLTSLAALGYLVYNYAIFGFSVAINPMTPVHLAVLGIATWALVLALMSAAAGPADVAVGARLPRRTTAAFLLGIAVMFAAMWLGQIAQAITSGQPVPELARLGLQTNPVYTLDLAFALPFLAVAAVRFGWHRCGGEELALAAVAWVLLMGLGVLAIFGFDAAAGAEVPIPVAVAIATICVAAGLLLARAVVPRRAGISAARMEARHAS